MAVHPGDKKSSKSIELGIVRFKRARLFIALSVIIFITLVIVTVQVGEGPLSRVSTPVRAKLNGQTLHLQLADTDASRQKGLSDQDYLPSDQGMLFVFDQANKYCFWMKDMNFPLDILWFDAEKKLVDQAEHVIPGSFPDSFCPDSKTLYVIELNAGASDRLKLKVGDTLDFKIL